MRIFLWLVALALCGSVEAEDTKFLVTIFRHGARREARGLQLSHSYPDEFTGVGDLTPVGSRQMYLLGKAIREKYKDFFSDIRLPTQISMPSSYYNRTITSGASAFVGLFDLGSGGKVEADDPKLWTPPIPDFKPDFPEGRAALPSQASLFPMEVHSNFQSQVFLPDNEVVCKGMREARKKKFKEMIEKDTPHFEALWRKLKAMGYEARNYSKEKKETWDLVLGFETCDLIISRVWNDETFKEVDEDLKHQCLYLHTYFNFRLLSDNYLPLVNQKINEKVLDVLGNFDEGKSGHLKAVFLSGHDTNFSMFLLNFFPKNHLCILERYKRKFPLGGQPAEVVAAEDNFCLEIASYSANIILEVYSEDDEHYVKFLVNNEEVSLPGLKSRPSLDQFIRMLENKTTTKWDDFCYVDRGNEALSRGLVMLTFLSFLAMAVLGWVYFREVKRHSQRIDEREDFKEKLVL